MNQGKKNSIRFDSVWTALRTWILILISENRTWTPWPPYLAEQARFLRCRRTSLVWEVIHPFRWRQIFQDWPIFLPYTHDHTIQILLEYFSNFIRWFVFFSLMHWYLNHLLSMYSPYVARSLVITVTIWPPRPLFRRRSYVVFSLSIASLISLDHACSSSSACTLLPPVASVSGF